MKCNNIGGELGEDRVEDPGGPEGGKESEAGLRSRSRSRQKSRGCAMVPFPFSSVSAATPAGPQAGGPCESVRPREAEVTGAVGEHPK